MCGWLTQVRADGGVTQESLDAVEALRHRGPDGGGTWRSPDGVCGLAHTRLAVVDLSGEAAQPMHSYDGRYSVVFNGEIYNHVELREQLSDAHDFRTTGDTEVLLAAYIRWGVGCLQRFVGMFSFAVYDTQQRTLFAARDRFGVKPLYFAQGPGGLLLASEIKALHAAGVPRHANAATWATYLAQGMYDGDGQTFFEHIQALPAGHALEWSPHHGMQTCAWYDLQARVHSLGPDYRSSAAVQDELLALLHDSVRLRLRSDVEVGVCLSGGLDSSLLLALVDSQPHPRPMQTFTFYCDDPAYDEVQAVRRRLHGTPHTPHFCRLDAAEVPELCDAVLRHQDEPFGGIPTLGMAKVHATARDAGVTVLLDGNGMDEGWAGYGYYAQAAQQQLGVGPVQGSRGPAVRPDCLTPAFSQLALPLPASLVTADPLQALQLRDITRAKLPRALRFADRVSMQFGRELREPFLDHRVVELGLRQPARRKIADGMGKHLVRQIAANLLKHTPEPTKQAVQTPQREWLAGPLRDWAHAHIELALGGMGEAWLDTARVRTVWQTYQRGAADNSFPIWQWISLGMASQARD